MSEDKQEFTVLDSTAAINPNNKRWMFQQDEKPFIEAAKRDREAPKKRDLGYKKACTVPTIVQLEIFEKYGIDMMGDDFMHDTNKVRRVLSIIKSDYPYLMAY
jgi:hypothetical protein